jgi:TonB family protein
LVSTVLFPALASASEPAPAAANAQPVRISTGVIAPVLVTPLTLEVPGTPLKPIAGQVGLSILVDENGNVRDVKVTRPLSKFWDARVAEAVAKGHFRPATLDHQAIALNVDLPVAVAE